MRGAAVSLLLFALGACAPVPMSPTAGGRAHDRVILLPGSDRTTGAIVVEQGGQQAMLDAPYAGAHIGPRGELEVTALDAAAVRGEFAGLLEALPPAPLSFTVYFVFGQDELTEESRKDLEPILQAVNRRPAPEVMVIGHADQAGPERINDTLALRRAERMRELLVQRGVSAERINVAGRGSREPAVRAPEGVAEARNRRVEVGIR